MNLDNDPRIERPVDPNAPKVLDQAKCQRLIRSAPSHARFPLGDVIQEMAEQLKCAMDELGGVSTKIVNAQNEVLRYKQEATTANAEVQTMQSLLGAARAELAAARAELETLRAAAAKPAEPATTPKGERNSDATTPAGPVRMVRRKQSAKVVPITGEPQQRAEP